MTYVLDDIADYLASNGIGSVGTDIFEGGWFDGGTPNTPDVCVALFHYPGLAPSQVLGGSANPSPLIFPRVQVAARASKYSVAYAKAQACYALLAPVTQITINGTRYLRIEALNEPAFIGQDTNSRSLFGTNFQVTRES